ncbi:MAG: hypothetical protein EHM89_00230 [Acidobacteria bacterium]|nr:MAG: hypothetical protein EHM89_00230 [Acidobacteriota bacterium]
MNRALVIALLCAAGVAYAQPIPPGGLRAVTTDASLTGTGTSLLPLKIRTDCSTNDGLKWNGTTWVCTGGAAITGSGTTNTVAKWTSSSALGNSSTTDDGTTLSSASDLTLATDGGIAGTTGYMHIGQDVNSSTNARAGWSLAAATDGNVYFDSKSFTGGTTTFRTGAGAEQGFARTWLTVTNSSAAVSFPGNATLGDSSVSDSHTVNGFTTVNYAATAASSGAVLGLTFPTAATGSAQFAVRGNNSGTYDTTAGSITAYAIRGVNTATESGGGNTLVNVGGQFEASGGDTNYALRTAGSGLIELAGATSALSTLNVTGLLTATAGGTTSANWTTTGTGDLVSADDLTVTDDATITGLATIAETLSVGQATAPTAIHASSPLFPSTAPKAEFFTGSGTNAYNEAVVIRHNGTDVDAETRRLGLLLKLSSEASVGESAKYAGILAESTSTFSNSVGLHLVTNDTKQLSITSGGLVTVTDDLTVSDDFTVIDDSTIGNDSSDLVGIGTAPDANHPMTFAAAAGAKIALFPISATQNYGFGIQTDTLQLIIPATTARFSFGVGDSDAFTERQRLEGNGRVWFGDTAATSVDSNVDVLTLGNTGTAITTDSSLIKISDSRTETSADFNTSFHIMGLNIVSTPSVARDATATAGRTGAFAAKISNVMTTTGSACGGETACGTQSIGLGLDASGGTQNRALDVTAGHVMIGSSSNLYVGASTGIVLSNNFSVLGASGNTAVGGTLDVTGAADFNSTLNVDGNTTFTASVSINSNTFSVASTATTTFGNGPIGINNYGGKHLEFTDEFFMLNSAIPVASTGMPIGSIYQVILSGSNSQISDFTAVTARPGIIVLDTGTTTTGKAAVTTSANAINQGDGTYIYEVTVGFPTLSTAGEEYTATVGFFDTNTAADQVDGCWFSYDRGDVMTNPGTGSATGGDIWQCWCSSNSTRTAYTMNGVNVSDESFTTVSSPVAALVYPNTNIYRLEARMTGSTRAEFYVDGTKRCNINTNIPTGSARLSGAGALILKSAGTTARRLHIDQTRLALDLTAVRSP